MKPTAGLPLALAATAGIVALLAALLLAPRTDLAPRRSHAMDLDEPGPAAARRPGG